MNRASLPLFVLNLLNLDEIVESLLTAKPKLASLADDDERLPIHWATSFNHKSIVDLLLTYLGKDPKQGGFEIDVQDGMGWTPLMIACSVKDGEEIVELLVGRGADVNAKSKYVCL